MEHEDDKEQFMAFVNKHPRYIQKPLMGQCGRGTAIVDIASINNAALHNVFSTLLVEGGYILEELILQDEWAVRWNPTSVNTVRIPSIRTNVNGQYEYTILQPYFRTGRYGQVVDNGGSGGIFVSVDPVSGMIISDACDEKGNRYSQHPDSHIVYKGKIIPHWQELVALSKEVHSILPSYHRYVGFDFALTPTGWVLVEANWGQFLGQYSCGIGIRKQFENLMNK